MANGRAGDRVTAADVARSLGISRATVGFVFNATPGQTISSATKKRVLDEAKRLGYRPHVAARALASGRSRIVLMVLPDWPRDFSLQTNLDEAAAALDDAGYSLVTMTRRSGGRAQPLWETLAPDVVLGLLPFTESEVKEIRSSGVEHVIAAAPSDAVPDELSLGFNDGPRLQVEHLLLRGRSTIAFAGSTNPRIAELVAQRRQEAEAAYRSHRHEYLASGVDVNSGTVDSALQRWLDESVDGIVAYNDEIAALVLGAALRAGVAVPEQLAIIGHDDTPLAALIIPPLSTVKIDTAGLGRYLAALALSAVTGSDAPTASPGLTATLVVRETT